MRRQKLLEMRDGMLLSTLVPMLSLFSTNDLKQLMCGKVDFSAADFFHIITFTPNTPEWANGFHKALVMLEEDCKLADLLQFITALRAIPHSNNFGITVQWDNSTYLCRSHTCANQLIIAHKTPDTMRHYILDAMKEQAGAETGFTDM